MTRLCRLTLLLLAAAAVLAVLPVVSGAATPAGRTAVHGSSVSWAKSASLRSHASPLETVHFQVYLGWRDAAEAEALAQAVSDLSGGSYGHYLSPSQFRARFAPSEAELTAVRAWLTSQGFEISDIPSNHLYVGAAGTVAQAENAFGVKLNEYRVRGLTLRAPATALTVPSSLAGVVSGVVGLDESGAFIHPLGVKDIEPPPAGYRNAQPWSNFWGQKLATTLPQGYGRYLPYAVRGYTPAQLRGAYGVDQAIKHGNDGRGVTVAIIDAYAAPTIEYDVNRYSRDNGLPTMRRGQFKQVWAPGLVHSPPVGDEQGWYGEETLDVEAVHTMAPGADILYVGALSSDSTDMDAAMNWIIDHHAAQIISNSYGDFGEDVPLDIVNAENAMYLQAAIEGIGVYFSSGDNGDEVDTLGYRSVDWSASSPWVTAVGGTSLGVGRTNNYLFETGWGTSRSVLDTTNNVWSPDLPGDWWYGGGGGTSKLFTQPWYQRKAVPPAIADYFSPTPGRAVPDVAMVGDPTTGMLIGETQTFSDGVYYDTYRVGGTSLSCPLFAGVMALADQRSRRPHGFANPALYAQAGKSAYRDIVDPAGTIAAVRSDFANGENAADGINYSARTMNQTESLHTIPGYDDVTGMGAPNGEAFLRALSSNRQ